VIFCPSRNEPPLAYLHACLALAAPFPKGALAGEDQPEARATARRTIQWNGLRAALDAAAHHPQQRASTEEAFTLLVRFGQAPSCGGLLELFARNAEVLKFRSLSTAQPALAEKRATTAIGPRGNNGSPSTSTVEELLPASAAFQESYGTDKRGKASTSGHVQNGVRRSSDRGPAVQGNEASSVLLGVGEIATLAAELDPMRRINRAFTSLAEALGGDDNSTERRRARETFRSPLHSYAVARRCRGWENKLEVAADCLATTRRKLGRRGQDILLEGSSLAAAKEVLLTSSNNLPPIVMSAEELSAAAGTRATLSLQLESIAMHHCPTAQTKPFELSTGGVTTGGARHRKKTRANLLRSWRSPLYLAGKNQVSVSVAVTIVTAENEQSASSWLLRLQFFRCRFFANNPDYSTSILRLSYSRIEKAAARGAPSHPGREGKRNLRRMRMTRSQPLPVRSRSFASDFRDGGPFATWFLSAVPWRHRQISRQARAAGGFACYASGAGSWWRRWRA